MNYEDIIKKITSGLTGNFETDVRYLNSQAESYKTHGLAQEILRAIGRLQYGLMSPEKRAELEEAFSIDLLGIDSIIGEAESQIKRKNYREALDIIEDMVLKFEDGSGELIVFSDDAVSEYHRFNNTFEEFIYKEMNQPQRTLREIPVNFGKLYYLYGSLLFELKRFDESSVALKKALRINPVDVNFMFELAEVYKYRSEWDEYLYLTNRCLSVAYSSRAIGRCYRNLGFYYIERQKYDVAVALYHISMSFDQESKIARNELLYIRQVTGKHTLRPSPDEVKNILKENKIQYGASELVLGAAIGLGKSAEQQGACDAARFFFTILYDLTSDNDVKKWIDRLPVSEAPKPDTRWYTNATAANPKATSFAISTADELAGLAEIVNGAVDGIERDGFNGKTITLTADIDLSQYNNWVPIGDYAVDKKNIFSGTFNGSGRVISNLVINRPDAICQGLFGFINGGRVESLKLDSVNISGSAGVGSVAGGILANSSVANCCSAGAVSGNKCVGGIMGYVSNNSGVTNCYSAGTVSSTGNCAGGVAGQVADASRVANCYSTAIVRGADVVGGVVGDVLHGSSVVSCYSTATVCGTNGVGGVVGIVSNNSSATNSAALNPEVKGKPELAGRVGISTNTGKLSNNIAHAEMANSAGNTAWGNKGADSWDGQSVAVRAGRTIGERFTEAGGWTTDSGRLPGLFGETVAIPAHLR